MIKKVNYFKAKCKIPAFMCKPLCSFLLMASLTGICQSYATNLQNIRLERKTNKLEPTIKTISDQTGYDFIYQSEHARSIDVRPKQSIYANIETALSDILKGTSLSYKIESQTVILERAPTKDRQQLEVRGVVVGSDGKPLVTAVVRAMGSNQEVNTDANGVFILYVD